MSETAYRLDKPKFPWLMLAFGLPFLLGGIMALSIFGKSIIGPLDAADWSPHKAKVIAYHLDSQSSSEGGTTYKAKGEFEYEWEGRRYTSQKIDFSIGYDSFKDYHKGIITQLRNAKNNKNYLRIYVNPKNPEQAVMLRRIRWKMFIFFIPFVTLFPLVGAGIIIGSLIGHRHDKAEYLQSIQHPLKPWKWQKKWQTGIIKSQSKFDFYTIFAGALFWNLISWPIAILMSNTILENTPKGPELLALFVLLFPIIGLFLVKETYKAYKQWKYFGDTFLKLKSFPTRDSANFEVIMNITHSPPPDLVFEATISCVKIISDKDCGTKENKVWKESFLIPSSDGSLGSSPYELPIQFKNFPEHLPNSSITKTLPSYRWEMEIKATHNDIEFDQTFEFPVFSNDTSQDR